MPILIGKRQVCGLVEGLLTTLAVGPEHDPEEQDEQNQRMPGTDVIEVHAALPLLRRETQALQVGDRQEAIMQQVMQMPDLESRWDSPEVTRRILHLLEANPIGVE